MYHHHPSSVLDLPTRAPRATPSPPSDSSPSSSETFSPPLSPFLPDHPQKRSREHCSPLFHPANGAFGSHLPIPAPSSQTDLCLRRSSGQLGDGAASDVGDRRTQSKPAYLSLHLDLDFEDVQMDNSDLKAIDSLSSRILHPDLLDAEPPSSSPTANSTSNLRSSSITRPSSSSVDSRSATVASPVSVSFPSLSPPPYSHRSPSSSIRGRDLSGTLCLASEQPMSSNVTALHPCHQWPTTSSFVSPATSSAPHHHTPSSTLPLSPASLASSSLQYHPHFPPHTHHLPPSPLSRPSLPQSPSDLCLSHTSAAPQSTSNYLRSGVAVRKELHLAPVRSASLEVSSLTPETSLPIKQPFPSRPQPHMLYTPSAGRTSGPPSPYFPSYGFPSHLSNCVTQLDTRPSGSFDEALKHYERVRSPSLRGHSRTTSISHAPNTFKVTCPAFSTVSSEPQPETDIFDLDLCDNGAGGETLTPFDHPGSDRFEPGRHDSIGGWTDEGSDVRDVFEVGERVGVGTYHQGYPIRDLFEPRGGDGRRLSMSSHNGEKGSGLLEIVRQIGVGSYAVVYLVREVLYDPDLDSSSAYASDASFSQTPRASHGFASAEPCSYQSSTLSLRRKRSSSHIVYGRDFALKCLCKNNLSDELLVLQRGEAELHRSLPSHNNIVALHRALETPNWLFLVIEYCPGQDLFYWLEQARDSQDLDSLASRTNSTSLNLPSFTSAQQNTSSAPPYQLSAQDVTAFGPNTPPSPSLLSIKADDEMLSRRRLRLISRMFVQMCDAVQACHSVGVCHRDIKPENFIVVDDRRSHQASDASGRSTVTVKITDWGLGTSCKSCEDFDCGSKPYMAYECRNNLNPTYDPVQADVWSLGIVLLNLLYHRCPWADPTWSDADFAEFRRQPAQFFCNRFKGMARSVAEFLADKVFCDVCPDGRRPARQRITAGEFGEWARDLLNHMGGGQLRAWVSDATVAISPSSARCGLDQTKGLRSSGISRLSKASSEAPPAMTMVSELESPGSPPSPQSLEKSTTAMVGGILNLSIETEAGSASFSAADRGTVQPVNHDQDGVASFKGPDGAEDSLIRNQKEEEDNESTASAEKAGSEKQQRRRKRGARKGRKIESVRRFGIETAPSSPVTASTRMDVLDGLAEASQSLAREISIASRINQNRGGDGGTGTGRRKLNLAERMMEKFRDGSNPDFQAFVARARAREAALLGVAHSNTNSAPAQLQHVDRPLSHRRFGDNPRHDAYAGGGAAAMTSASSSSGATTASSLSSWAGGSKSSGSMSELSHSTPPKASHWNSASSRRERIQKTNQQHAGSSNHPPLPNQQRQAIMKKEDSKNRLAVLLTSFKRFNSTLGSHPPQVQQSGNTPALSRLAHAPRSQVPSDHQNAVSKPSSTLGNKQL